MKRRFIFIMLISFAINAYSLEIDTGLSLGTLGVGFNINKEGNNGYWYGRILNFICQFNNGLGFSFSPIAFSADVEDTGDVTCTFVNTSVFYNFFKEYMQEIILGPFVSLNSVEGSDLKYYMFNAGVAFTLRSFGFIDSNYSESNTCFKPEFVYIELGYKYKNNNNHGFYAHAAVDLIHIILFFFSNKGEETYKEYNPSLH